jgi:hypothetical protein
MASCEKCWEEAGGDPDYYHHLLRVNNCTPEEQAGEGADECPRCHRRTIHCLTLECVNPQCSGAKEA